MAVPPRGARRAPRLAAAPTVSTPAAALAALDVVDLPADAVEVGRIGDAWGIQGWFKVIPHSADPEALFSSRRWLLQPAERGARSFEGTLRLPVREARTHTDAIVASSPDIPDRTAAEALKGARVFVPRSSFPTAADGEYYWVDLIGLAVVNREGVALGTVRDLLSTGPQTVLVLQYDDPEGRAQERMVPFVDAYIDSVDLAARRIVADWQPDY